MQYRNFKGSFHFRWQSIQNYRKSVFLARLAIAAT